MYNISISITGTDKVRRLQRVKAGQTLLELLLAKGLNLRHDCGGVCHCTTCHVWIAAGAEHLDEMSKRESDFLKKVRKADKTTRLACQALLLEGEGQLVLRLPGIDS